MNKIKFNLVTIDGEEVEINTKNIIKLYTNEVVVKTTYLKWLKTGKFSDTSYELTPENLNRLVQILEGYNMGPWVNISSSKVFLESFPTTDSYNKKMDKINNLPKLD